MPFTKDSTLPTLDAVATENRNISRYETTAVYTHTEAEVDIVLVHGLNGRPDTTWTAPNGTFWPVDLLPASLRGVAANILVYGYNADVYSRRNDRSASDNFIHQHAQTLVTSLTLFRRGEGRARKPIIWVAHSLGGILVKRALLYSNDLRSAHHEEYRSIFVSTYGIIFLGTPHTGADAATWGLVLQCMSDAILPRKFFESESILLKTLKKDNETLANINNHFLDIYQRFRIHMVHENHKTDIKGTKVVIVDANSASPQLPGVTYYGVEATHGQMCKFDSPHAPGFRAVSTDIRQWVIEAPSLIQRRWVAEECERSARMQNEITERMSPFVGHDAATASSPATRPIPPSTPAPPYAPTSATGYNQEGYTTASRAVMPASYNAVDGHYMTLAQGYKLSSSPSFAASSTELLSSSRRPSTSSTISVVSSAPPPYDEHEESPASATPVQATHRRDSDMCLQATARRGSEMSLQVPVPSHVLEQFLNQQNMYTMGVDGKLYLPRHSI